MSLTVRETTRAFCLLLLFTASCCLVTTPSETLRGTV